MGTDIGAKIGIDGEAAFRSSLAAINSQLKNLGSEMKSVISAFSGMENSEGAVTAKGDVLKRSLNASAEKMKLLQNQSERAKARLATLSDELEKSKQKFGENSEEARKAQDAYNRQVKTVNDLQTKMNRTTTEMNRMEQEMQELGNSSDALSKDLDKTEQSSARMKAAMKAAVSAAAAAVGTLSGLGIAAIKVGSDFEESMSQVAATMGMSVSEIHNGSEAYETLATAAKNAGATTKFTATQAAEALNYLALAGYDAGTSAEVLPSVLNLAAAGGLDLAYASDLATDAMAALGIEASADNLTQFGDQMARASSKANYSVAQLGEAILTVGGTAKNLAGGTVELNTALGVLANRGIKGAEGGTALRNMILSLSAPTDKAAATLKSLGVSAFDAEGNLNPLNETFKKLDAAMQSMSQEQKTNVLNNIFNKVDLKSAEAMLAGCGVEFDNLSASIASSSGAMQDMADVQMDNLKGQMTILGSGLEGLGIQVYEKFETPMKEAAETAITSVDEVARNLRSGKLSESVDNLAESTGHFMEETTALAVKALPKAINALAAMLRHTKEIKNVTLTAAAAIGTFKAVQSLSTVVKSWQAAEKAVRVYTAALAVNRNAELLLTSTLSAKELVVGVVTGKIALMTTAQTAYNAVVAACPLGLLIAGAAALTIGLVSLLSATEEESTGMREFRKRLEETTDSINQQAEARKSMKETAQESINQSLSEMDYTDSLIRQLQELCDANGQVKDGYENRAKALAEQINSVIPNAISLTEKEGQAYVQTADNLDLLMEKKRVNALLNAKEETYTAAIQNQAEAMQNLITLEDDIATKKQELIEKEKELQDALMNGSTGQQTKAMSALQQVKDDLAEMEGLYTEQTDILRSSYQDIDEYNSLLALSQSNSLEEIKNGLNEYVYQQQRVTDETKDQLDQQLEVTSRNFATRLKMAQDAGYDIGQAELDALMSTKDDFLNAVQAYADAGREVPKALKAGVDENAVLYANALVTMKDKGLIEMKKAESEILRMAAEGVSYAKQFVQDVEFSPEDASRTDLDFLTKVVETVIDAGATTVNIPDTVGYTTPDEFYRIIRHLKENVPNIGKAVHCHNDLGLAVANSLAAVRAGARQVEGTINGIGERAGNVALEEVIMALRTRAGQFGDVTDNINTKEIVRTSRIVARMSGMQVQRSKAIVGENAFAHSSGIHQHGILNCRETYEVMDPQAVGWGATELPLTKHSGRAAVKSRLEQLGHVLTEEEVNTVFERFKKVGDSKKFVYDDDLSAIVDDSLHASTGLWELDFLQFVAGSHARPTATVGLLKEGKKFEDSSTGNGAVDAVIKAIERITRRKGTLKGYSVNAASEGKDALGEVTVHVDFGQPKPIVGKGASTDVIEASARAYLNAVNRSIRMENMPQPNNLDAGTI